MMLGKEIICSKTIWFYLLLIVFSIFTNMGLGNVLSENIPVFDYAILFVITAISFYFTPWIGRILITVLFLSALFYCSAGFFYGIPSLGIIASVYETNINETLEYYTTIPFWIFLFQASYIILFVILMKLSFHAKQQAFKWLNSAVISLLLVFSYNQFSDWNYAYKFRFYPVLFYSEFDRMNDLYLEQRDFLNQSVNAPSQWDIQSFTPKYKNYILIIGESMRKDYMSLYGFPLKTTPFLDRVKGTVFENYYSAAPNTQPSLQRTLYRADKGETVYTDNIISLAKKAGVKTYWISNQGKIGEFDTMASRIGQSADETIFMKPLGYNSKKVYDDEMLPVLDKALKENITNPKLIVIHLMGSHPAFCERLPYEIKNYFINQSMSCYLESIKYTDQFLEKLNSQLVAQNEPYSVIYFSDHGLAHYEDSKGLSLHPNNLYKQDYEIPFVMFSSNSQKVEKIKTPQSAFNFVYGFADWMGIKEKHLQGVDFFRPEKQEIKVFDWKKVVNVKELADDPAKLPEAVQ